MLNYSNVIVAGKLDETCIKDADGINAVYSITVRSEGVIDKFFFRASASLPNWNNIEVIGTPHWHKTESGRNQLTLEHCSVRSLDNDSTTADA